MQDLRADGTPEKLEQFMNIILFYNKPGAVILLLIVSQYKLDLLIIIIKILLQKRDYVVFKNPGKIIDRWAFFKR